MEAFRVYLYILPKVAWQNDQQGKKLIGLFHILARHCLFVISHPELKIGFIRTNMTSVSCAACSTRLLHEVFHVIYETMKVKSTF